MGARTRISHQAPQVIATLAEIDEALWWTSHQPRRDVQWRRWCDALLDKRNEITGGLPHQNQEGQ